MTSVFQHLAPAGTAVQTPRPVLCQAQTDGVRFCQASAGTRANRSVRPHGGPRCAPSTEVFDPTATDTRVPTQDGAALLDVNVTLPAAPASGTDGSYPLVIVLHGYGGSKTAGHR